jgi:NTP pyrophosphatase (non-canonical NTP hydrolase)
MLGILVDKSRLPSSDSTIEITVLEKAEEEVIELLEALRHLKNHYSPVKSDRKKYSSETLIKALNNLIDEIGDVIVDAAYMPSVILPGISLHGINKRIREKLDEYEKVVKRLTENDEEIIYKYENGTYVKE